MGAPKKRVHVKERLRAGFLATLPGEIKGLAELLAEDPTGDLRDTVAYDLGRIGERADSLELPTLRDAATAAAARLETGDGDPSNVHSHDEA